VPVWVVFQRWTTPADAELGSIAELNDGMFDKCPVCDTLLSVGRRYQGYRAYFKWPQCGLLEHAVALVHADLAGGGPNEQQN